ncbi:MAG: hypothetical protein ACTTHE_01565 [Prevotella multiformis]|uniref:hypothetical protein n=1 Tax=Prevotella multiformis TaxID=282402 RepID=UPI003F9FD433
MPIHLTVHCRPASTLRIRLPPSPYDIYPVDWNVLVLTANTGRFEGPHGFNLLLEVGQLIVKEEESIQYLPVHS